jgi:hypothetical protein
LLGRLDKMAEPTTRRRLTLGELAPRVARPLLHAVLRAGHAINEDAAPHVLHRLRVRVKRLRYAFETLVGLLLVAAMLEVLVGRNSPDAPHATLWFVFPAMYEYCESVSATGARRSVK